MKNNAYINKENDNKSIPESIQKKDKPALEIADNRTEAHNINTMQMRANKNPLQRFVLRVGYNENLEKSPNKAIANSQKTVKKTADNLSQIDSDTVNAEKIHDHPTTSLTQRGEQVSDKTPVFLVGHGRPGGMLGTTDMAEVADNTIKEIKTKNQEIESVNIYSCFSLNDENLNDSSVAKWNSELAKNQITGVPVLGAKGILIPRALDVPSKKQNVNVIPRRYCSYAYGKKISSQHFKTKFTESMNPINDGTWENPKGEALKRINEINKLISNIFVEVPKFLVIEAVASLPPQELQTAGSGTQGGVNFEEIPNGEPTITNKLEAVKIGALLTLNTIKNDVSSLSNVNFDTGKIDTAIEKVNSAYNELDHYIKSEKFNDVFLSNILS